jgi:germination protein M
LSRTARKSTLILTSLKILVFATAVGAGGYAMRAVTITNWQPLRAISKPATHPSPAATTQTRQVNIYVVKIIGSQVHLVPMTRPISRSLDPKVAAIKELLAVSSRGGDSAGLIPPGSRFINLNVDRGLATLDLSREFVDNFHGGSLQESLTLEAITRTLTQFRDVSRVRILVEGRAVDTLGGHFSLSEPLSNRAGTGGSE